MSMKKILIVDDEENMRHVLTLILEKEGYKVTPALDGKDALLKIDEDEFDIILSDIKMPGMDGIELLNALQEKAIASTIIMMSAYGTVDTAIEAMKLGAYDYISKPFKGDEIILTLRKAEERKRLETENRLLRDEVREKYDFNNIVAKSHEMHNIFKIVKKIAPYKTSILLTGESGTGKELIAKAIHHSSNRSDQPFIAINCGAIPENLLESELFGFVKGAFTDATQAKKGLFQEADKGTLFLDEIGELPLMLQVKFLRVLQEEEIRRIGDNMNIKIDVRMIAVTAKNLETEVKEKRFREDLFYRLNVMCIDIPPLRERKEDIPLLTAYFIDKYNERLDKSINGIDKKALDLLINHPWKGNVRELENAIERAMIFADTSKLRIGNFPQEVREYSSRKEETSSDDGELSIRKVVKDVEKTLVIKAVERAGGNKAGAARLLEISYRSLMYKLREYDIDM